MGRGTRSPVTTRIVSSANGSLVPYPPERLDEVLHMLQTVVSESGEALLKPRYRTAALGRPRRPYEGHCYVVTEALFHLMGGKEAGYCGVTTQHEGGPHWWLRGPDGAIHDGTALQFQTPVPYERGRGCGFQGRPGQPSARARVLIEAVRDRLLLSRS